MFFSPSSDPNQQQYYGGGYPQAAPGFAPGFAPQQPGYPPQQPGFPPQQPGGYGKIRFMNVLCVSKFQSAKYIFLLVFDAVSFSPKISVCTQ